MVERGNVGGRKGKDVRAKLGEIYERKGEGRKGEVERSNKRWTGGWDGCNIPYLITRTGAGAGSGGGGLLFNQFRHPTGL